MAMSKDRVEFTLAGYYFEARGSRRRSDGVKLIVDSFGIIASEADAIADHALRNGAIQMRCRPSQFARFLINREQAGFQNMYKELNAKLIVPDHIKEPVDVSGNEHAPSWKGR